MTISSREIIEILKAAHELGYQEFRIEYDGFYLSASSTARGIEGDGRAGALAPPAPLSQPRIQADLPAAKAPTRAEASSPPAREGLVEIVAPMSGTFYRSPSPGAPPFVEVGSSVKANDVLCIIEVMKLFNSIRSEVDGTVEEILVDNEAAVVAGQVVIRISPKGK